MSGSKGLHRGHTDLRVLQCHLGAMVMSMPRLLPRSMSESLALLQLGSVLMSVTLVETEGHAEAGSLG